MLKNETTSVKETLHILYQCLHCEGSGCKHCYEKGYVGPVRHKLQCHELNIKVIYKPNLEC